MNFHIKLAVHVFESKLLVLSLFISMKILFSAAVQRKIFTLWLDSPNYPSCSLLNEEHRITQFRPATKY